MTIPSIKTEFLRHTLATLAYRGGKAISAAPSRYSEPVGFGRAATPEQAALAINVMSTEDPRP